MTLRLRRRHAVEISTGAAGSVRVCPAASQGQRARAVPGHTDFATGRAAPPQKAEGSGRHFTIEAAAIIGRG